MKKIIFIFILIISSNLFAQIPYRIRLADSTYSAQLIGVAGKRTAGDTIDGVWSSTYKLHEFDVEHTGPYQLYVDPAGGTNYVLVSSWGKTNGKVIAGYDWLTFWEAINSASELMSIGIGDTSISTSAIKDSNITMPKLSTTVHAAMGAYGAGTYPPDDVELEFTISGLDTLITVKDSWINQLVQDSVKDAIKKVYYVSNYSNIDACVSAAGSNESVIVVDGNTYNIAGSYLTIPANINLKILKGGQIDAATSKYLYLNCTLEAGIYQIFGDSITVTFSNNSVKKIYPEWWGDSDTSFDKMWNSISNLSNLIIELSDIYTISTIKTINSDTITMRGNGINTGLFLAANSNIDQMLLIDSCSYVTIDGITFNNNEANQTDGELRCIQTQDSVYNLTIKNCIFEGNGRSGASGSYGIWIYYCYDSDIDNIFVDGWNNQDFMSVANSERVNIRNSNFKNLMYSAITLRSAVKQFIIANNFFYNIGDSSGSRGHAVAANTGQTADETIYPTDVIIQGNIADKCFGDVINIEQGFRFVISSNVIRGFYTEIDTIGDTGISCSAAQSVIIGNHVSGNGSPGITLFNQAPHATSYDMAVVGNVSYDNGVYTGATQKNGIWLDDVQRCIVTGNVVGDSLNKQDYGIKSSGTSKYNIIADNVSSFNQIKQIHFTNDSLLNIVSNNYEFSDGATTPFSVRMSSFFQQGDIDPKLFGGHKNTFTFYFDNVPADTTTAQIYTTGGTIQSYEMPKDGSVLAIAIRSNAARITGTLVADVYISNSSIGLTATLDGTNTTADITTQDKDTDTFNAQSTLSIKITSTTWSPITADIIVSVLVEM